MIAIDFATLRPIGLTPTILQQLYSLPAASEEGMLLVRITEVQRDRLTVHDGQEPFSARARRKFCSI